MINRELIRIKEVQIVYSYYQNGGMKPEQAETELQKSLSNAYDMYNYLLQILVDISHIAMRTYEMRQSRATRLGENSTISTKFIDNRFILQLESNKQLSDFRENMMRFHWMDYEELIRSIYTKIEESDYYKEYMESEANTYEEDRELWRRIYRTQICNNEQLDDVFEDVGLYWNDDKAIVDTFVLKTINRFSEENGADQPLLPEYRDQADQEFAIHLCRRTLANEEYYRSLIAATTRKWEVDRIALMDRIIMQLALAEITTFPEIPVNVTINEYVEVAKMYGTPNSPRYINATLDHIVKDLTAQKKLVKNQN